MTDGIWDNRQALDDAMQRWAEGGARDYAMVVKLSAFVQRPPVFVYVEDGSTVWLDLQGGQRRTSMASTVEELFEEIETDAATDGLLVWATFDPDLGYPRVIYNELVGSDDAWSRTSVALLPGTCRPIEQCPLWDAYRE